MCLLLHQLMVGVGWIGAVIRDYPKNVSCVIFTDFGKHRVSEGFSSYYSLPKKFLAELLNVV